MRKTLILLLILIMSIFFTFCNQLPEENSSATEIINSTLTSTYSVLESSEEMTSSNNLNEESLFPSSENVTSEETKNISKNNTTFDNSNVEQSSSQSISSKESNDTSQSLPTKIEKEPLPDGVVCGYDWLKDIARAATEEELLACQKEKGWDDYLLWCFKCGRPVKAMKVDGNLTVGGGLYGTCTSMFGPGTEWTCANCNATIPINVCHTCGE